MKYSVLALALAFGVLSSCAAAPAYAAYTCAQVRWAFSHFSKVELDALARANGATEADRAAAQACLKTPARSHVLKVGHPRKLPVKVSEKTTKQPILAPKPVAPTPVSAPLPSPTIAQRWPDKSWEVPDKTPIAQTVAAPKKKGRNVVEELQHFVFTMLFAGILFGAYMAARHGVPWVSTKVKNGLSGARAWWNREKAAAEARLKSIESELALLEGELAHVKAAVPGQPTNAS